MNWARYDKAIAENIEANKSLQRAQKWLMAAQAFLGAVLLARLVQGVWLRLR